MSRIFGRGELKLALLEVLGDTGPSHGYALMQALEQRIGGGWKPSPGAIYPALLALECEGLVIGADGEEVRFYSITSAGNRALDTHPGLSTIADRAREPRAETLGSHLDRFASSCPTRRQIVDPGDVGLLENVLQRALDDIELLLQREDHAHG